MPWAALVVMIGLAACQQPAPQSQDQQQPVPGQMPRMGY
jgi:hypothetical protein